MSSGMISPARSAAFALLTRVATTAAHSDDLLHAPAVNALSAEDRNLTTALVLGVLRWQMALDAQIRPLLQRPDTELHPAALLALRLGLFQLQHLNRIPPHAAINESVELARANGAAHAAGMVNALLRRWLREQDAAGPARQTLAAATPAETAHPAWLLQRWRAQYGGRNTRLLAAYDQVEPPTDGLFDPSDDALLPQMDDGSRLIAELAAGAVGAPRRILDACAAPGGKTRVLALRHPAAEIVAADVSEKRLAAMRLRLDREPAATQIETVVADLTQRHVKAAVDAEARVRQDGDAADLRPLQAADDGENTDDRETGHGAPSDADAPGAVVGTHVSNARHGAPGGDPEARGVTRDDAGMAEALTDGDAKTVAAVHPLAGLFDLILVDAPCSGTGTLARNPEIRHRLRESDLPRQAERQRAILKTTLRKLAPGGRLVYSTCSLEREENEAVITAVIADGGVAVEPVRLGALPGLSGEVAAHLQETAVTAEGALRTLPGVHACDGFYAVVLRKLP